MTTCPTCREPVTQPAIGRRRTYCSPECRRQMHAQVGELGDLERQLAAATSLRSSAHTDTWRQRYEREMSWLRLAIDEARSRIPDSERTSP